MAQIIKLFQIWLGNYIYPDGWLKIFVSAIQNEPNTVKSQLVTLGYNLPDCLFPAQQQSTNNDVNIGMEELQYKAYLSSALHNMSMNILNNFPNGSGGRSCSVCGMILSGNYCYGCFAYRWIFIKESYFLVNEKLKCLFVNVISTIHDIQILLLLNLHV